MSSNGSKISKQNGNGSNGHSNGYLKDELTAGNLYQLCLEAKPIMGEWFSIPDTACRLGLTIVAFYRFLLTEPFGLLRFAYGWNKLWYGWWKGPLLTLCLPVLPFVFMLAEFIKRLNDAMPWAEVDWKFKGPGRVFFTRPPTLVGSLLWDFYGAISTFSGSYLQFANDEVALEHTWYDSVCVKEFWMALLDAGKAPRPMQLARWDGQRAHQCGPGVGHGKADLVCKISDSYLGIGDKVLVRGKDFSSLDDVQAILAADAEYAGKSAILAELVYPSPSIELSSDGFGQVHTLDLITMRTRNGVKVLTVLLWTNCEGWSSHSTTAGYVVDVHSETIVANAAWYSPSFVHQSSSLIGKRLPGVRVACEKAIAAHECCDLPWLTTIGWDAMLTADGVVFFEGNVANYRTPRRMFLSPQLLSGFWHECRGKGSPVPWM